VLLFGLFGCSKKNQNFPKVYPCQIVVHNKEQPEKDVRITLYPSFASGSLLMFGKTDTAGRAIISTSLNNFVRSGVPKGEYTVVLEKILELKESLSQEEIEKMLPIQRMEYRDKQNQKRFALPKIIPDILGTAETSPVKFEVKDETGVSINVNLADY
jgi:hypothetical protein